MKYKLSQYVMDFKNPNNKNEIVLFNAVTGGIIGLTNREYTNLKKCSLEDDKINDYLPLLNEGFLILEERNEYEYLKHNEYLFQQNFHNDNYLSYVIAPTTACNLRCKYCFESGQNSKVFMNDETIEQILIFILNDVKRLKIKRVSVVWFGGEPLLCFDQIIKLGSKLKSELDKQNIEFTSRIISNGILLTKQKTEDLVKQCNLTTAQITLDGLEREYCLRKGASPDNYKQVLKNIVDIADLIKINLRLNVDKLNVADMKELANKLLIENGLNNKINIFFSQLRDYGEVDKHHKVYFTDDEYGEEKIKFDKHLESINAKPTKKGVAAIPKYRPIYCALSHSNNYAIGPEGELYKCEHYFGVKEKVIGDVWNGLYYNDEYFNHIKGVRHDTCSKCSLYPICQSTCPETFRLVKFVKNKKCNRYDKLVKMLRNIIVDNLKDSNNEK